MSPAPQVVTDNPNASVAATAGAGVTLAVWVATMLGVDVPPEVAAAAVTLFGSLVLYLGKKKPA
jgi:NAD(P)H-hydrate repair Nnr-like enzyme with NAD(P)H-hydrate dehydratase domain